MLDNCMGSGSTGVAAVNTGRNFIGIEMNEDYFASAKERIEQTAAQMRISEGDDIGHKAVPIANLET